MCNNQHHLTATIYDKRGRILSIGKNSYLKTHTLQKRFAVSVGLPEKQYIHAEIDAILKCRNLDKAHRIMVVRYNKKGEPLCAKPCKICMAAIEEMTNIQVIQHT